MKYLLNVIVYKYYDEPQVYLASEFRFIHRYIFLVCRFVYILITSKVQLGDVFLDSP